MNKAKSLEAVHTHTHTHGDFIDEKLRNRKFNICLVSITFFITLILQVILIFNHSVWGDEAFTMLAVQKDLKAMWNTLILDVHPPLYYIILKIAMFISNNNFQVAKLVSILPLFLMNLVIIILTLKNKSNSKNKTTGILLSLFLVITTSTSNFLYMGQELRMYSLATFFVTISGIYAYKTYNDTCKKNIAIFIISSLASALTHYFALIMEVVIYVSLFIALLIKNKKSIKQIVIILTITILGYIWWLPIAIKQVLDVKNDFWLTFDYKDIFEYIEAILGVDNKIFAILSLFIIVLSILILYNLEIKKKYQGDDKKQIVFAFLSILLPFVIITFGIILNLVMRPVFTTRYLLPSLGLFWIGVIILLNYTKYKPIAITVFTILILSVIITQYPIIYIGELKTGTENTIKYMKENLDDEDIITSNITHLTWTVLKFYLPDANIQEIQDIDFSKENKTIWLFSCKKIDESELQEVGYKAKKEYVGDIDYKYPFTIYKLVKR